jgi:hypothetical protein
MALRTLLLCALLSLVIAGAAFADAAPFDLAGPGLQVRVTHGDVTLPISEVPNLSAGDQLWVKADLPEGQSVHYLLVTAFLRGATNPPPKAWFYQAQTWTKAGRDGLKLIVPAGAKQVIVFLAPQTGGDFDTLVDAVRGRPGAFVRASQDLNQAALDRSRLDAFLDAVRRQGSPDPDRLKMVTPLLARSLTIKLNTECLDKMPELQAACLMEGRESLVLNDGHSTSIVEALTTGNPADLVAQLGATPQAGYGYYSPYIAAVADIARILDSIHTAQFQYIPALSTVRDDKVALLLNTPPSFHNPLSVLVTALPAIEPPQTPPLQPVDPKAAYCAQQTDLVLPVDGAPLAYSTHYAHDMMLRLKAKDGRAIDLPVRADAEKGGFIVDITGLDASRIDDVTEGVLRGSWGFEAFDGPRFQLQTGRAAAWRLAADDQQALITGRDDTVHLQGQPSACVSGVTLQPASGEAQKVDWKPAPPDGLAVTVPLGAAQPGAMTLLVKQYGVDAPDPVALQTFAQAGRLDSFSLHAGDPFGLLKGSRLDEVASLTFDGVAFKPGAMTSIGGADELTMEITDAHGADKLKTAQAGTAKVVLKDGRSVRLKVAVDAPRPRIVLIGKSVQPAPAAGPIAIELTGADEAPQSAQVTFSVRVEAPMAFSSHDAIEVATQDGSASASLTPGAGLTLEDAHVAIAVLDPAKALGPAAFGALRFRVVLDGAPSDWRPLITLVRLPSLQPLKCAEGPARACVLPGSSLFLIDAVANNVAFEHPVEVPEGFPGYELRVPHPVDGRLYLKLRDDPQVINAVMVSTERHAARPAAGISAKPQG